MHRSQLGCVIIDCQTDDLEREARFWSQALGYETEPEDPSYITLKSPPEEVAMLLQKVEHPSRVHIDIETDDKEAEAARLEKLGAKRIAAIKDWIVMEAPSGHRFCLVNPQRKDFEAAANAWS